MSFDKLDHKICIENLEELQGKYNQNFMMSELKIFMPLHQLFTKICVLGILEHDHAKEKVLRDERLAEIRVNEIMANDLTFFISKLDPQAVMADNFDFSTDEAGLQRALQSVREPLERINKYIAKYEHKLENFREEFFN